MITPTVGRKVWYRPNAYDKLGPGGMVASGDQPCDATVIAVHSNTLVNLAIFDHQGNLHKRLSVPLLQDDMKPPASHAYAEWMPYQTTQAAKNAAE